MRPLQFQLAALHELKHRLMKMLQLLPLRFNELRDCRFHGPTDYYFLWRRPFSFQNWSNFIKHTAEIAAPKAPT